MIDDGGGDHLPAGQLLTPVVRPDEFGVECSERVIGKVERVELARWWWMVRSRLGLTRLPPRRPVSLPTPTSFITAGNDIIWRGAGVPVGEFSVDSTHTVSAVGMAMRSSSKTATSSSWPPMPSTTERHVDRRLSSAFSIAEIEA